MAQDYKQNIQTQKKTTTVFQLSQKLGGKYTEKIIQKST